jgi:squalene-hopene/tetraprenyl-beta-curcumene cyclase
VVVIALLLGGKKGATCAAVERAVRWVRAMRSRNGAWGAFDKDNTRQIVYKLPFADFGALLDPPSEDVTAHVLEMLGRLGCGPDDAMVAEGVGYLRRTQRSDGSWFGRWGVNHIYGSWCVMTGLAQIPRAGEATRDMMERGTSWLLSRQNADGGWGETCYSYEDQSFAGVGESTASQTAWALLALEAAGLAAHPACQRGLLYLQDTQDNGTWHEPLFTGTGFPRDFYLNYHMYRHLFPLLALGTFGSRYT